MVKKTILCVSIVLSSGLVTVSAANGADRSGEQVFQNTCALCHTTGVGPILTDHVVSYKSTLSMVRNGFMAMPAFRPTEISDKEIQDLARYLTIQTQKGKQR